MEHNVHGSLITNAQLCEQTHSAIARMSEGVAVANVALRSTNGLCEQPVG